jgi:hypothetical protein
VIVVCAYLLGGHLLTLPKPAQADPRLARALAALRAGEGRPRWIALHVLYEGCRCSRRVFDHLVARGASPAMAERVLLVGGSEAVAALPLFGCAVSARLQRDTDPLGLRR